MARRILPARARTAVLLAGLVLAACGAEPSRRPNLLLLTIDTLRADHLSSYGYPRQTSPVLDRLGAEGVRFDQATAQWPKTGPSFASLLSATYPKDNNVVRRVGRPVPHELRLLAEELAAHGYATHAVVANGALASELNYDQGFTTYDEVWKLSGDVERNNHAAVVTRRALETAATFDRERPYFLWVHYIDPHFPYEPPPEWRDKFQDDAHFDRSREIALHPDRRHEKMLGIAPDQVLDGRTDMAFYVARYDAEIAYIDHQIGVLLDELRSAGRMEDTLTVVTSDHGESLGDHEYYFSHGRFGYQSCLWVPLLLHHPGVLAPRVDTAPVDLIHVAPTLLEAAGVALEGGRWMQGRSLFGRLRGAADGTGRYSYAEAGYALHRNWQRIVRDERFKLIYAADWKDQRWITGERKNPVALFDLASDPHETRDVAAEHPAELRRLKRALAAWWNAEPFDALRDAASGEAQEEMTDETREQLRALGYLR